MKLKEAIEIIEGLDRTFAPVLSPSRKEALRLAKEALKRVTNRRSSSRLDYGDLLQGETDS